MPDANTAGRIEQLSLALEQLRSALELLDRASAPSHIGAHVDLAIHELYLAIAVVSGDGRLGQIERNASPQ